MMSVAGARVIRRSCCDRRYRYRCFLVLLWLRLPQFFGNGVDGKRPTFSAFATPNDGLEALPADGGGQMGYATPSTPADKSTNLAVLLATATSHIALDR